MIRYSYIDIEEQMMSRIPEALLGAKAFNRNKREQMLDPTYGGQFGWSVQLTEWINNAAYVPTNLKCILLEAPLFFQLMPEPNKWVQVLRSLVELHAETIEGLEAGLEVTIADHNLGGAGEVQHEYTDVKRTASSVTFKWTELYGRPIQTFLHDWITYGLMDPDVKYAMISTLARDRIPLDHLPDWYSMSALFYETDRTHRTVVKAWVGANMFPKGTKEISGKKDKNTAPSLLELPIEFTGHYQFNLGTKAFAQRIIDEINQVNANPFLAPSFIQQIDKNVEAAVINYKQALEKLGSEALTTNQPA